MSQDVGRSALICNKLSVLCGDHCYKLMWRMSALVNEVRVDVTVKSRVSKIYADLKFYDSISKIFRIVGMNTTSSLIGENFV